ncbi:MAG TPA: bifunctional phosphopantothenoylcysteine decarboxylase/phosphopantothenate--cysteine ligase CoaBC [Candidatus Poseidoniales archaeon]|nr:MAG TPA: bifunctional phosphopantothenoylcysteine decarboxylase/phosphopantothenate--cysteine ligase CoaBC [Candidatus Poseidoniales archaeon]
MQIFHHHIRHPKPSYVYLLLRRTHECSPSARCVVKDTGVVVRGSSMKGKKVLFLVSGGIAAVESVRLSRELRRHQAQLTIMMSRDAEKIISPLALSWASGQDILTDWNPKMQQLENYDTVLVAPATRNTISKHIHGIMDSPLMMALSAARGNRTPIVFVPSMHQDLFDDPVTTELLEKLIQEGSYCIIDSEKEGRRKQPSPTEIVAKLANITNSSLPNRKKIAITLGATRAPIDSVRAIQNASSGKTGWAIAEHLFMMGHDVRCIVGKTSASSSFELPNIIRAGSPEDMLSESIKIAKDDSNPDVWIHAAAVLDYSMPAESGKRASGQDSWNIELKPTLKHISELSDYVGECVRIGFKLETSVSEEILIKKSLDQISKYGVDAVVANLLEQIGDNQYPRARFVIPDGSFKLLNSQMDLCNELEKFIC